jgi:hypothetical protein
MGGEMMSLCAQKWCSMPFIDHVGHANRLRPMRSHDEQSLEGVSDFFLAKYP